MMEDNDAAASTTLMKKVKRVNTSPKKVPDAFQSKTSPAPSCDHEDSDDHRASSSLFNGRHASSTPKSKTREDRYSNKSVVIQGKRLSPDEHKSYDRYAYFHLGRPIPSELRNIPMPHGRDWCNPCCMQDVKVNKDCGYCDYDGRSCGSKCPGKYCDHNLLLSHDVPERQCVAPPDHKLHVYHDVVDLPDPQLDGTQDVSPPCSPPPACQGNYIKYSVLNPIPWQRSPGGGHLLKWTPWYYDRRTHEYSFTKPDDFDSDGSFHTLRSMDSLASSFDGTYATDGSNLYKLEDTGPAYFLQPGWDDLEASHLQSSSILQHSQPGWDEVEGSQTQSMFQSQHLQPGWDYSEEGQLQSSFQHQHLQPGWDDVEASHLHSSSESQHLQPGWDYPEINQLQLSSQTQKYTIVDQAIVHKMFLKGQAIPANLVHVPQPHGQHWCHPDCLWLGSQDLPYECGYHPDWGNIIPCSQTCPGGYCSHTETAGGGERAQQGLHVEQGEVDEG